MYNDMLPPFLRSSLYKVVFPQMLGVYEEIFLWPFAFERAPNQPAPFSQKKKAALDLIVIINYQVDSVRLGL